MEGFYFVDDRLHFPRCSDSLILGHSQLLCTFLRRQEGKMKSMFAVALFLAAPAMADEVLTACDYSQLNAEIRLAIKQGDAKKGGELGRQFIQKAAGPCADAVAAQRGCAQGYVVQCAELQKLQSGQVQQ
jgi:hypothetical protein